MTYAIVDPEKLYRGKSYSNLVEDWFSWFISADADKRNFGPVVFLRSSGIPYSINNANGSATEFTTSNIYSDDPTFDKSYPNNPNIRVGGDKLVIRTDQAVFWPIIVGFEVARKGYVDWGFMQERTGLLIDGGDDPPEPEEITIDGVPITSPLIKERKDLYKFRILSNLFTTIVPDADYGKSVKDFLEESYAPGQYVVLVEGYFLLLEFKKADTYLVHSKASAGRETGGPYFSELLYQIKVENRSRIESKGVLDSRSRPARNEAIINRILAEKTDKGELKPNEVAQIKKEAKLP